MVITTPPGEEAQVDYGDGPMVRDVRSGKYRRTRLFVLTLGYSRKSVRLLVGRSSAQVWAELHERAFRRLGGAPARFSRHWNELGAGASPRELARRRRRSRRAPLVVDRRGGPAVGPKLGTCFAARLSPRPALPSQDDGGSTQRESGRLSSG